MNIKLTNDLAKVPTKGSAQAAGYDLYAATDCMTEVAPHASVKIDTGVQMAIYDGFFGMVVPRSGIASNRRLILANTVGIIDSDYRGNIIVNIHNDSDEYQYIKPHERIAQIIFVPYMNVSLEVVDELSATVRGEGGFGSTGTN